jgi:membrane protease YdiL (CAAX protease family)
MSAPRPTIRSANWLYLASMGLIITLGGYLQSRSLPWGLLATEVGLILVPALVFLRLGRLEARTVLRWRWPGWALVMLGAVIGAGIWGFDMGLQSLAGLALGYTPPSLIESLPADPLNLVVFAAALALAAPLCEEVFFRGYVLSAYERFQPPVALLAVGLLFAFFHLQFAGLLALLPIALVLGLLAYRSNSLAPAIAAHLANNSLGAATAIVARLSPAGANDPTLMAALCGAMLIGPVAALAALWFFLRQTRSAAPPGAATDAPAVTAPPLRRGAYWPLVGAALIYTAVAGLELVTGRFPQVLADRSLRLEPAPLTEPQRLAYTLWNVLDEPVGEAACAFTPQAGVMHFECISRQRQFEVWQGRSMWAGGRYELRLVGYWDAATMRLLDARMVFDGEFGGWTAEVGPGESGGLSLTLNGGAPVRLPADAVLAAEWPYRFMALPFGRVGYMGSQFNQVMLSISEATSAVTNELVLVRGEEDVPGTEVRAWKVQVGRQTAW